MHACTRTCTHTHSLTLALFLSLSLSLSHAYTRIHLSLRLRQNMAVLTPTGTRTAKMQPEHTPIRHRGPAAAERVHIMPENSPNFTVYSPAPPSQLLECKMCVCVWVCVCVCALCVCVCVHVCVRAHLFVGWRVITSQDAFACAHPACAHTHTRARTQAHSLTHTCARVGTHAYAHMRVCAPRTHSQWSSRGLGLCLGLQVPRGCCADLRYASEVGLCCHVIGLFCQASRPLLTLTHTSGMQISKGLFSI